MTDVNGSELHAGDTVLIEATITGFSGTGDDGPNVQLVTTLPARGTGSPTSLCGLNTGELVLLQLAPSQQASRKAK